MTVERNSHDETAVTCHDGVLSANKELTKVVMCALDARLLKLASRAGGRTNCLQLHRGQ